MSPPDILALREYLGPKLKGRTISDAKHVVSLTDVRAQSCLAGKSRELSGRSVLLAASGQLLSALAMIELDGVARRILLCPPDLDPRHIEALVAQAEIDTIVTDRPLAGCGTDRCLMMAVGLPEPAGAESKSECATEWLMLTSGTSGLPKIVSHTLDGLEHFPHDVDHLVYPACLK